MSLHFSVNLALLSFSFTAIVQYICEKDFRCIVSFFNSIAFGVKSAQTEKNVKKQDAQRLLVSERYLH